MVSATVRVRDPGHPVLIVVRIGCRATRIHLADEIAVAVVAVGDSLGRRPLADQLIALGVAVGRCTHHGIYGSQAVAHRIVGVVHGVAIWIHHLGQPVQRVIAVVRLPAIRVSHLHPIARSIVLVRIAGDYHAAGLGVGQRRQPAGFVVLIRHVRAIGIVLPDQPAGRIVRVGRLPTSPDDSCQTIARSVDIARQAAVRIGHCRALTHHVGRVGDSLAVDRDIHPSHLAQGIVRVAQADVCIRLGQDVAGRIVRVADVVVAGVVNASEAVGVVVAVYRDVPIAIGSAREIAHSIVVVGRGIPQRIGLAVQSPKCVEAEHGGPSGGVDDADQVPPLVVAVLSDVPQGIHHPNQSIKGIVVVPILVAVETGHLRHVAALVIGIRLPVSQSVDGSSYPSQGIVLLTEASPARVGLAQKVSLGVKLERRGIA